MNAIQLKKIINKMIAEQMGGRSVAPVRKPTGRPNVSQSTHPGHSMEEVMAFIDRGGLGGGRPGGQSRNKWQDFKHMLKSANPFGEHDISTCPMHGN
jgi:hypothetical protein